MRLFALIAIASLLSACTSTEPQNVSAASVVGQPQNVSAASVVGQPMCVAWFHDVIDNPTGDYQACKYNHRGNDSKIEQCMKSRGWRMESNQKACQIKSYTQQQRTQCIRQSIVAGKVDHNLIASCLSSYTPVASKPINQNALRQIIAGCLQKKDRQAQQLCLNKALKRR